MFQRTRRVNDSYKLNIFGHEKNTMRLLRVAVEAVSVARFCKFLHFGTIFKALDNNVRICSVFGKISNPLCQLYYAIG